MIIHHLSTLIPKIGNKMITHIRKNEVFDTSGILIHYTRTPLEGLYLVKVGRLHDGFTQKKMLTFG
jgi:hypothetical protein